MEEAPRKHLSLLRSYTVADVFTAGNAGCGALSIFFCLNYIAQGMRTYCWLAMVLPLGSLFFDVMDGYWARRSGRPSALGAELDSLADAVSFGVAPAVLGFTLGLRGGWDVLVLVFFVVCGISRLARFNVTAVQLADERGKVKYFEGTPITTSILVVAVLAVAFWQGAIDEKLWLGGYQVGFAVLHPLALVYALSGAGMVSATIRIPKP